MTTVSENRQMLRQWLKESILPSKDMSLYSHVFTAIVITKRKVRQEHLYNVSLWWAWHAQGTHGHYSCEVWGCASACNASDLADTSLHHA